MPLGKVRLARETICFSELEKMHDTVIGLLINKVEFGLDIYAQLQVLPTTTFLIHSLILIPLRYIGGLNPRLEFDRGYPFPMLFFEFLYNHDNKALL